MIAPSRAAVLRLLLAGAVGAYLLLALVLLALVEHLGGAAVWIARAFVVFGASFAAMTLLPRGPRRAWLRVQVAKHLFRHRYDYRAAWLRLTAALAAEPERPLPERIERALAELVDAPAARLLSVAPDGSLVPGAGRWPEAAGAADAALVRLLEAAPRVLDGDALRSAAPGPAASAAERAAAPAWLLADPTIWAAVPLAHGDRLAGLLLLARPRSGHRLDWEDHDILSAAGRQAASHLAEAQGQAVLAEARRFHEFNRRFAFIVHDIKNLASQLGLLARNAERHADNPAFRADMVATLRESVDRLGGLLGRLDPREAGRADPPVPARPMAVLEQIAAQRRAQHPVRLAGAGDLYALIDPARLAVAVGHLVQNAAEAGAPAMPVWLAVERRGGEVAVTVRDRGRGMAPAFVRDSLFAPFRSTKPGGFGVGAFEARTLVTAMGGRLEVASHEGEGTCFTLLFPAAEPVRLIA